MYSPDIILYSIIGFLFVCTVVLFVISLNTQKKLRRLLGGKKPDGLDGVITDMRDDIGDIYKALTIMDAKIVRNDARIKSSLRSSPIIRFNPFMDQGGNQSFAVAIIDEEKDGVVISSLYARERMSIFAKSIKNGKPEQELSDEEKEALALAINKYE